MALTKIKGLQMWCRKMTEGYRDVEVKDMTTSFKSGLAFCAIIHRFRPDLIDYDSLSKENIFENNDLAFTVAEKELDIPALLEAADMVAIKVPDKLSVITYVSQYHNYFRDKPQLGGPGVKGVTSGSVSLKRHTTSPPPASAPETKRFTPAKDNNFGNVSSQISKKQTTIGDKCDMCHNKVYLLERQIENGKLYHRSCYRHSELSPTSSLFKNSSSFASFLSGSGQKVGPEIPKCTENKPSWVKGDGSMPKTDFVASHSSETDSEKNLFPNDSGRDIGTQKSSPREDNVITRYLNQMKDKEADNVPKYQKKRPLIFQTESEKEEKKSEEIVSTPHFNVKKFDNSELQVKEKKYIKDKTKHEIHTDLDSNFKSEGLERQRKEVSSAFSSKDFYSRETQENAKINTKSELVLIPKPKEHNLLCHQNNNNQIEEKYESKVSVELSPVPSKPARRPVLGRLNTPPQHFKSRRQGLADSSSPESPESPPPPLPSSQPPSAPSSAEKSNLKSPNDTSKISFESSIHPIPKTRQVRVNQSDLKKTSISDLENCKRTEEPMEIEVKKEGQKEIPISKDAPSDADKNVLSGLLKSLAHVRQTEEVHTFSDKNNPLTSTNLKKSGESKISTDSNITITSTKTKPQETSQIELKNISEISSNKLKFLKKDIRNKVVQDLKHPAPKQNKDFILESKLTDSKNQEPGSSVSVSRIGNQIKEKSRPKSAFVISDNKQSDEKVENVISSKKELDKKDKMKSKSTEDLFQIDKAKVQDDNLPSWKKEIEKNKAKKIKLLQQNEKHMSKTKEEKISETVPSWKTELKKKADNVKPKSSQDKHIDMKKNISQDLGKVVSKFKTDSDVTPAWKKQKETNSSHLLNQGESDSQVKELLKDKTETKMPVPKKRGLKAVNGEMARKTDTLKSLEQTEVDKSVMEWQAEAKRRLEQNQKQFVDPEKGKVKKEVEMKIDEPQTPEILSSKQNKPEQKVFHSTPKSPDSPTRIKLRPPPRPPSPPRHLKKIPVDTKFSFTFKSKTPDNSSKTPSVSPIGPPKPQSSTARLTPPRPLPPKIHISPGRLNPEEFQNQLFEIDTKLTELELRGRELEDSIRNASTTEEEDDMMIEWFRLISAKNELVRKEADLIYIQKEQELEDEQENLDAELRRLLNKPDSEKTDKEREYEEFLLNKKLGVVNARSSIVDSMDEDKQRYEEEDEHIAKMINEKVFSQDIVSGKNGKSKDGKSKSTWYT